MPQITLAMALKLGVYWVAFWNTLYICCPPREWFNSPRYNLFLKIVMYYGGLNVRRVIMRLYGVEPTSPTPPLLGGINLPPKEDK